jgi:SAM-dependent methyltransferase
VNRTRLTFITAAAGQDLSGICYLVGDGAALPFGVAAFGAVTAFMSLMDVAEPERTLGEVARVLRPGRFVQFSVLHRVMSAPVGWWVHDESGVRQARAVGGYFTRARSPRPGPSAPHRPRCGTSTRRSRSPTRRTLAGWLGAVLGAGLVIEAIAEPCADEETAASCPLVADTRIAPYFLIAGARKP